jgi:hypothetical protein
MEHWGEFGERFEVSGDEDIEGIETGEEVENGDVIIGCWYAIFEYCEATLEVPPIGDIAIAITDGGIASNVCKQFARCDNNLADVAESTLVGFGWDINLDTS